MSFKKRNKQKSNTNKNEPLFTKMPDSKLLCLDERVDAFIKWYYETMVKGIYTDIGEFHEPIRMRDFIEKMAVWYEIRYPDYEVNRMMPGSGQEQKYANQVFINQNHSLNTIKEMLTTDERTIVETTFDSLDWQSFLSAKTFIDSLPSEEKWYLSKYKFNDVIWLNKSSELAHFHVNSNGTINEAENIIENSGNKGRYHGANISRAFIGMNIIEARKLLKSKGMLDTNSDLDHEITSYYNHLTMKNGLLDCVMYRIIERGRPRLGPRRAFLFAREFNRDIDIPIMYGLDSSDPGLREFINEYLKAGGSVELECYQNYNSRKNNNNKINTISISDILKSTGRYTDEEEALQQRLVNVFEFHREQNATTHTQNEVILQKSLLHKLGKKR